MKILTFHVSGTHCPSCKIFIEDTLNEQIGIERTQVDLKNETVLIETTLDESQHKLLENFDAEVHEKLKLNQRESQAYLDTYERWLWDVTRYYLGDYADFADHEYSFTLKTNPFENEDIDPGPYKIGKNVEDAHVYRPGHSLAQRILNEVKSKDIPETEIVFDYSNQSSIISVLEPLVGKSGVLKVSNYTVEAFEKEDAIVLSAIDESGESIEADIIKKVFSLTAQSVTPKTIALEERNKLDELEKRTISLISGQITVRNGEFFDDEVSKLDNWSDDVKKALELDLRKLDIDIKSAKTNAKKIVNLEEKLKTQREIKDSEKKRNEMRKQLYDAQDEVEAKKEQLLEQIEAQLKQRSILQTLFVISWKII
jgi:copper chaperone CopZ